MVPVNAAKLTHWHRRAVIWTSLALGVTGLVWMAVFYAVAAMPEWDGPGMRSKLHLVIIAHGIVGYAGAVVLGSLLGRHVHAGLHARRKVLSGVAALVLGAALIVTALMLYYAGGVLTREVASIVHQVCGVLAVVAVTAHVVLHRHRRGVWDRPEVRRG